MGIEWLAIGLAVLIAGGLTTADRVPATRPAVRTAARRGGKAAASTAKKTWSDRRAARRKKAAAWWKATKPRRAAVKVVRITGKAVTSTGALTRDSAVVVWAATKAGAVEAHDGWKAGREEYRQAKADKAAAAQQETTDSAGTEPAPSGDSTVPQPRTGEAEDAWTATDREHEASLVAVGQGGVAVDRKLTDGFTTGAVSALNLAGIEQRGTTMTAEAVAAEQVDLTSVVAWCDGAFSSVDGSQTIGYVQSGTQLYESFGGAIAGIGGAVAAAATAEQEAASAARDALAAWGESVLHLRQAAQDAIGG